MPINYYDLQRFAAVKVKEDIRKKGSPNRFGKGSSSAQQGEDTTAAETLVGRLLKQHVPPKK